MPSSSPTTLFPTYLLPTLSFRRRSSASTTTSSNLSTSPPTSPSTTTAPTPTYLAGNTSLLRCAKCLTHLCHTDQIISKGFTGRHGRAYLVAPPSSADSPSPGPGAATQQTMLSNTHAHKPVPRQLVTGAHTVADVSCTVCSSVLGWKYVAAEEEGQRYKVGKFILETKRVLRGVEWEGEGEGEDGVGGAGAGEAEFDSQDEDECEDLFAGVWSPGLARTRRRLKAWRERGE